MIAVRSMSWTCGGLTWQGADRDLALSPVVPGPPHVVPLRAGPSARWSSASWSLCVLVPLRAGPSAWATLDFLTACWPPGSWTAFSW